MTKPLPPKNLRKCGKYLQDDQRFIRTAEEEADKVLQLLQANPASVVDIGCGVGRLAYGLDQRGFQGYYLGIDVDKAAIAWCRHTFPEHTFHLLDMHNARYLKTGQPAAVGDAVIPREPGTVDVCYLYSVFTHLEPNDVEVYLSEFGRVLKPTGCVTLTAWLEDDVADVTYNPVGYPRGRSGQVGDAYGPLHRVLYNQHFFESLCNKHGLYMSRLQKNADWNHQHRVELRKK